MLDTLKHEVISLISRVKVRAPEDIAAVDEQRRQSADVEYQHESASAEAESEHPTARKLAVTIRAHVAVARSLKIATAPLNNGSQSIGSDCC